MKKPALLITALLIVAFSGITVLKRSPEAETTSSIDTTAAARAQTHRFWEVYRTATQHRLEGRFEEAAARYRDALALNGTHEDALYYLGNVHLELGHYQEAEQTWQRLAHLNAHSPRTYAQLGTLYLCYPQTDLFSLEAADAAFRHAMHLNKEESGPLLHLAELALLHGNLHEARYYLDAVATLHVNSVEANLFRGYLAWKQSDLHLALAHLSAAVEQIQAAGAAKESVIGEGDTKTGRALVARTVTCPLFAPPFEALEQLPHPPTARQAIELYRRLDAFLTQVRAGKTAEDLRTGRTTDPS